MKSSLEHHSPYCTAPPPPALCNSDEMLWPRTISRIVRHNDNVVWEDNYNFLIIKTAKLAILFKILFLNLV